MRSAQSGRFSKTWLLSSAVLLASLLVAPAQAAGPGSLLPPQDLHGRYDAASETVTLTWTAPLGDGAYQYNVYRNGELLDTTSLLGYTEHVDADVLESPVLYYVTAVMPDQQESSASNPVVLSSMLCPPVGIGIDPLNFPYVFVHVHEECIPGGTMRYFDVHGPVVVDAEWRAPS